MAYDFEFLHIAWHIAMRETSLPQSNIWAIGFAEHHLDYERMMISFKVNSNSIAVRWLYRQTFRDWIDSD